ncbi:UDP-N-acetylmuramoyl-L-alanine--D-glutamate ligase [Candidatus Uhrbacteria bacterium]|jgi:UDP-N-acetylmuramoylalanine--D-glutamate ligase|nr:UDP-N-acetylmuramoyl-L-alanine--D-glutamate ligase [Candidatus Uhrbacteria bacterium]
MTLEDLGDKKIIMIGFEATNRSFFHAIRKVHPTLNITIADANLKANIPNDPNVESRLGPDYLEKLGGFDVIVRSPGVRYWPELEAEESRVITATEIFFATVRSQTKAKIIGITGTKGKSTVSSLMYEVLRDTGKEAFLVGNIDNQDWDIFDQITDSSWIVYELSSYMLEDFNERPDIAVLLGIFPDHMNWHGDFETYAAAKANITRRQTKDDLLVFNSANDNALLIADHSSAFRIPVNQEKGLHVQDGDLYDGANLAMKGSSIKLLGDHNKENVLLVLAVAKMLQIPYSHVEETVSRFTGLPHRLEAVVINHGISFYDDAISTTPESTIAAIRSFNEPIGAIILGGEDRGYDYGELALVIAESKVSSAILLPGARQKIESALNSANFTGKIVKADTMKSAVAACFEHAPKGSISLLSSAAPSYDTHKSFKEQGDEFQELVKQH